MDLLLSLSLVCPASLNSVALFMYGLPQTSVNWAFCEAVAKLVEARETQRLQKSQAFLEVFESLVK